jgi:hydrogenase expression/formation protein HypC
MNDGGCYEVAPPHADWRRCAIRLALLNTSNRVRRSTEGETVCLAIPGQIVEITDAENSLARVDVVGVRRTVNVGLLDGAEPGDWVLIHVGFALSKIDEEEALATRRLLELMGAEYEQELEELKASAIE